MRPKYTHTINAFEEYCIEKGDVDFASYIEDIEQTLNIQDDILLIFHMTR